jgi:hypothetical protein
MPRFGNFARCSARNTTVLVHHFKLRFKNFARCSACKIAVLVHHFKPRFGNFTLCSACNTTVFRHLALPRIIALFFLVFISVQQASSQDTLNDTIRAMLLEVSENRLLDHVRELENAGGTRNRVTFTAGKDSAGAYIRTVFESMPGIDSVEIDTFYIASAYPPYHQKPQVNIVAVMEGTQQSDEYYVIGSHYDSTADRDSGWDSGRNWQTIQAPGANDNGSGVAALLEMARVMSDPSFGYRPGVTVKFVAFGAEERLPAPVGTGNHHGSRHMARQARLGGHTVLGMVSVDMIGYNERHNYAAIVKVDNDMAMASAALGARYVEANQNFFTGLIMNGFPFANGVYSDHQSFAVEGYPAILIIENAAPWNTNAYYSANPYYHQVTDTYNRINYELVRRVTQLNIAALASSTGIATGVHERLTANFPESARLESNFPNPFNPSTTIRFALPVAADVRLEVFDTMGRAVAVLAQGVWPQGEHQVRFDASGLPSGVYLYRLVTDGQPMGDRTMVLVR